MEQVWQLVTQAVGLPDLNITFGTMMLPWLIDCEVNLMDLQSFVLSKKICVVFASLPFLLSRGEGTRCL